ncbi:hypothetical protein ACHQM5_024845 [Ranunculus cassubicifolius]
MASVAVSKKLGALAVNGGGGDRRRNNPVAGLPELGRRGLLLSVMFASASTLPAQAEDSKTALLQKYLKKSEENKVKNDKERLDDFYKRNYKDYFEFIQGGLEGKKEEQLTEAEKDILNWLKAHK